MKTAINPQRSRNYQWDSCASLAKYFLFMATLLAAFFAATWLPSLASGFPENFVMRFFSGLGAIFSFFMSLTMRWVGRHISERARAGANGRCVPVVLVHQITGEILLQGTLKQ